MDFTNKPNLFLLYYGVSVTFIFVIFVLTIWDFRLIKKQVAVTLKEDSEFFQKVIKEAVQERKRRTAKK